MSSTTYYDGILSAYRGELIGEHLYRTLAARSAGSQAAKLNAIADIEQWTYFRLQPIAVRLKIHLKSADWMPTVDRRLSELSDLSWTDFIANAWKEWPPYIERFQALKLLAPTTDAAAMQALIEHEIALVDFVQLERSGTDCEISLERLRALLRWDVAYSWF